MASVAAVGVNNGTDISGCKATPSQQQHCDQHTQTERFTGALTGALTGAHNKHDIVCNGVLCYLYCKMDIMVHDTLVKLCADHFDSTEIEAARQMLYNYDAIKILNIKKSRRRQGPTKDRYNIEDMLLALHKCRSGLPTFAVSDLASAYTRCKLH